MGEIDKRTEQVNVKLTPDENRELQRIIVDSAPEMSSGQLMRLAWLYFRRQVERNGLLAVMADILGA